MISDYYYANIIECTKEYHINVGRDEYGDLYFHEYSPEFKKVGPSVFKKGYNGIYAVYKDVVTGLEYSEYLPSKRTEKEKRYIDVKAGIIQFTKFLDYTNVTKEEKKYWIKMLRSYDKLERLEKQRKKCEDNLYGIDEKVKKLGGLK